MPALYAKRSLTAMVVSPELIADSMFDIGRFIRGSHLYTMATFDGRIEVRGGGWYRLDGQQFRGRWQVRDELVRLAGEEKA